MKMPSPILLLTLLLALVFTLAAYQEPRMERWITRGQGQSLLAIVMGDGRQTFRFLNYFTVHLGVDVYFHSGFYPSIFEQARQQAAADKHMAGGADHDDDDDKAEPGTSLGPAKDWVERFGRNFYPNTHTHLDKPR